MSIYRRGFDERGSAAKRGAKCKWKQKRNERELRGMLSYAITLPKIGEAVSFLFQRVPCALHREIARSELARRIVHQQRKSVSEIRCGRRRRFQSRDRSIGIDEKRRQVVRLRLDAVYRLRLQRPRFAQAPRYSLAASYVLVANHVEWASQLKGNAQLARKL